MAWYGGTPCGRGSHPSKEGADQPGAGRTKAVARGSLVEPAELAEFPEQAIVQKAQDSAETGSGRFAGAGEVGGATAGGRCAGVRHCSTAPDGHGWAAARVTSLDVQWQSTHVARVCGVCGVRGNHGRIPHTMLVDARLTEHAKFATALQAADLVQSLSALAHEDENRTADELQLLGRDLGHVLQIGHARRLALVLAKVHRARHGLPSSSGSERVARLYGAHSALRNRLACFASARQRQA